MEAHALTVRETVNVRQEKLGEDDLAALFRGAKTVVVAKGKKSVSFDPAQESEALNAAALGRSGNLRAPTIKVGQRFLVGFSQPVWEEFFS